MAPSVDLDPERVSHSGWSGEDVSLDQLVDQLNRLRSAATSVGRGDYELPRPRNSVMNLVAIAADQEQADRAARVAEELGARHPSRTVVVLPMGGRGERIDAAVRSHAHDLVAGAPVQYEEIRLRVWGTRARLRSLVEPLLVPDVRTHLWYLVTPPWEAEAFLEVLPHVDTLVVDSATFEQPYESFLALSRLAAEMLEPQGTADFQWVRLRSWRELIAQLFAPHDRRPFLHGLRSVRIEYEGDGQANPGAAVLLAGWLVRCLHWELRSGGGSGPAVYRISGADQAEIAVEAVKQGAAGDGRIVSLDLKAAADGSRLRLAIRRDREELERARIRVEASGLEPLDHEARLGLASAPDSVLLSELLVSGRRDPIYVSSMRAAEELLRAL